MTPIHNDAHQHLGAREQVVCEYFTKWKHEFGQVVQVFKNRAPVCEKAQNLFGGFG